MAGLFSGLAGLGLSVLRLRGVQYSATAGNGSMNTQAPVSEGQSNSVAGAEPQSLSQRSGSARTKPSS